MQKLKKARRMLGLTQHQMANLAGIPPSRIAFAETGRTKFTLEEIEKIKAALAIRAQQVKSALAAA